MAATTLPRHEIPWGQQRDLDDLADHIGSKRYHGRHRAEDGPAVLPSHIGWAPAPANCTCPRAECGYVDDRIDPACPVHTDGDTTKMHRPDACPGRP